METLIKPKVKLEKSKRRIYKNSDGVKVPGVTTILACIAKNQLIDWSAKVEREGILNLLSDQATVSHAMLKTLLPEKYFFTTIRDSAASVGTICHFMCECYLKNQEPDLSEFPKEQVSLAENGFIKFLEFWEKSGFTVVHTEHPLVHNEQKFAGTLDVVCMDKENNFVLVDLKTSKAIYPEYWSQVSAYAALWLRNISATTCPFERHIIVRIGKDEANDLEVIEKGQGDLSPYLGLFYGALQVYNAQKEIGKT